MTYKYNRKRHTSRSSGVSSLVLLPALKPDLPLKLEVIDCVRGVRTIA
jgi:hypothetical protein